MRLIIGSQNSYTYVLDATAKTLTLSGFFTYIPNVENPFIEGGLVSIYDKTAGLYIPVDKAVLTKIIVAGLPIFVYTFPSLPVGVASSDVLLVEVKITMDWAFYELLNYQTGGTPPAGDGLLIDNDGNFLITNDGDFILAQA